MANANQQGGAPGGVINVKFMKIGAQPRGVEFPAGTTIADMLRREGLAANTEVDVNDEIRAGDHVLADGDVVMIKQRIAAGR